MDTSTSITAKLVRWGKGDAAAFDEVYPLIEPELKRLANSMFRRFRPGETLQPTALLDEAYLKLSNQKRVAWKNRSHFYAIAATSMRRIICSYHRDAKAKKRGSGAMKISLSKLTGVAADRSKDLIALDEALDKIAEFDPRKVAIVEMRFFVGLSVAEIAEQLGISESTVNREWKMARLLIHRMLRDEA
jgi:RNA polymerase sigma factor (TIGR02999 family)